MSESDHARSRRDQRAANDAPPDHGLMCQAHGCPNVWTVDAGNGRLCSAHAWVGRHLWPQVTQEQQDAQTERAYRAQFARPQPVRTINKAQAKAVLRELFASLGVNKGDGRKWARDLQAREDRGEKLTQFQRDAWRTALRYEGRPQGSDEEARDA